MQTLTITNAKKNLGRLLEAAAQGLDIGIISGANIIALRKVEVESTDYAQREYGVTRRQVEKLVRATDRRHARMKRRGKLKVVNPDQLKNLLEKAPRS